MFEDIEREIQENERQAQLTKQEIIQKRLEKIDQKRRRRMEEEKEAAQKIGSILTKEKKKQMILNKILQNNR